MTKYISDYHMYEHKPSKQTEPYKIFGILADPEDIKALGFEVLEESPLHIKRLYTMAEAMMPCGCNCPAAITQPVKETYSHGDTSTNAISFRAICTECLTTTNFNWDEGFFRDYTA